MLVKFKMPVYFMTLIGC